MKDRHREMVNLWLKNYPKVVDSRIGDAVSHASGNAILMAQILGPRPVPPGRDPMTEALVDYIAGVNWESKP